MYNLLITCSLFFYSTPCHLLHVNHHELSLMVRVCKHRRGCIMSHPGFYLSFPSISLTLIRAKPTQLSFMTNMKEKYHQRKEADNGNRTTTSVTRLRAFVSQLFYVTKTLISSLSISLPLK